ncbi:MAG: ECF-type sigma factor [Acidobacteriota bacterium]
MTDDRAKKAGEATAALKAAVAGDLEARDRLWGLLEGELRSLAGRLMRSEKTGHTLQPTAVVHEAFLQLGKELPDLNDRRHFLAIAAKVMRRVLVQHARRRDAAKRGGEWERVQLDDMPGADLGVGEIDVLALHQALERLAELSERQASIVELRWFGGLTFDEIAAHHEISPTTAKEDWAGARTWLRREMG